MTPDDPAWFAQMATVALPPCDHEALQRRLYDDFAIEVPTFAWNGGAYLRISAQAYNAASDVVALLDALGEVLPGAGPATGPR